MSALSGFENELRKGLEEYPVKPGEKFSYGTAGFRTLGDTLESVLFKVGILAALRSKSCGGKTIGVMITASHNPAEDNGVKLVDPRGEMLDTSWESHATDFANAPSLDAFIAILEDFIRSKQISLGTPAKVVYARDTRASGPKLVAALRKGFAAMGAVATDAEVTTTPILHYLVDTINTTTQEWNVNNLIEGYYLKLSNAFKRLLADRGTSAHLLIDCANGVGALAAKKLDDFLGESLTLKLKNTSVESTEKLNKDCGADYVKVGQKLPPSLTSELRPGQRGCSLDGDADRLIYYYLDDSGKFRMLDGDKITTLVASFIMRLVKDAGLDDAEEKIKVGVVQTAYANGSSTRYLSERLPVTCVPTGVKHLHHAAAERYDIGVYFEANGHGTVLFSSSAQHKVASHKPSTAAQATALGRLKDVINVINQTVGDALSDMLLVEVALYHMAYSVETWDKLYSDLPNRLVKVKVGDRNAFVTEDAERRLVRPPGLQAKIDELVRRTGGRSFVRPSGTEDVVRVYAEAKETEAAIDLALRVAGLVYDEAGGDPAQRPADFR
ncbi:phosphoacetylglucosamine mutase [Boletus edulis BED1]|uniref:Phosphoacetylglucosamine mutase n=1 Tax=Boletus edulis BED1 TaxID=1328754 RepID=A0AAD4C1L8_BOLED|nr:phosphoacetylglucosamine mutase [Boletus edulis BED1]